MGTDQGNKRQGGAAAEALAALSELDSQWGFHPHVLLAQWEIYSRSQQWPAAYAIAVALVHAMTEEPIGWIYRAFALDRMGRTADAAIALLPAARQFPKDWRIAYNLACYVCQGGDRAGAWNWLDRAIELGEPDTIKSIALDEPALRPLWEKLGHNPGFPEGAQVDLP